MSNGPQLEDVPDLMQLIQLHLPVKEAARTSLLSTSWLHAWSTIPTLRFCVQERGRDLQLKLVHMESTLKRYIRDNLPIETFDLDINIDSRESASLAEKCIRDITTKTCTLKELSLSFHLYFPEFNISPHVILSCENLTKIRVLSAWSSFKSSLWVTSHLPVIVNCVSLRELHLSRVKISQELLDGILSTCRLLVKIDLVHSSLGITTIKVTNLLYLYQLRIVTEDRGFTALKINDVPNLCLFTWGGNPGVPLDAHSIPLGSSLKELSLSNSVTDNASLDMIKVGAPFLESLTIDIRYWKSGSFRFTCASIKRLCILSCPSTLTNVKVYAPNLLFLNFEGDTMPTLLFPISTPIEKTNFKLDLHIPVDASFFIKMREALRISSNCEIHIIMRTRGCPQLDIDINDIRKRIPFPPAMNVQQMYFETRSDKCMWERSPFFDAFFEICHPNNIRAIQDRIHTNKNHFCKVMLTEVLEKKKTAMACWPRCLKNVQISRHDTNWESLTSSHKSFLEEPTSAPVVDFKLEWR